MVKREAVVRIIWFIVILFLPFCSLAADVISFTKLEDERYLQLKFGNLLTAPVPSGWVIADKGYQEMAMDGFAAKLQSIDNINLGERSSITFIKRAENDDFLGSIIISRLEGIPFSQEVIKQVNKEQMMPYMSDVEAKIAKIGEITGFNPAILEHKKYITNDMYFIQLSYLRSWDEPNAQTKVNTITNNYRYFNEGDSFSVTFSYPVELRQFGQPIMEKVMRELRLQ